MSAAAQTSVSLLHICSDYARQRLYPELVTALAGAGCAQYVYVPVRTAEEVGRYRVELPQVSFRYAHILRPAHRLLFRRKVRRVTGDLLPTLSGRRVDLVHAHFLYSDGAVARKVARAMGIPYVVSVRNTDLNYFMRLRPDLFPLALRILLGAQRVICLSPAYGDRLLARLPGFVRRRVGERLRIVPNGLQDWWLDRPVPGRTGGPLRLIYVGDFSRNKNLPGVLRAARLIRAERDLRLVLVGGGGDGEAEVASLLQEKSFDFVSRTGTITDREELARLLEASDILVMPSFRETFGIAYIEALSRGVPVVHSRGQGIAGLFPDGTVAEAVDPADPADIAAGIRRLAGRREAVAADCVRAAARFRWSAIAREYASLYQEAMSGHGT